MLVAHISDLHLGKTLHNFSLIEDQVFILNQIVEICKNKKVDILMVSGDIYDKNVAPEAGIRVLRKFLNDLVAANIKVLLISGNHDSAERLTFGAEFMTEKGIYFSKIYDGNIEPVTFTDDFGPINFYLLPFVKPSTVKYYFQDEEIDSYDDAIKCAIKHMKINPKERNIILTHQNILNAERCESEEAIIGNLDAVNADYFKDFDYTALGHIHKPQKIKENIYFCGTPLKYSTSELNHQKTMPVINFGEKGKIDMEFVSLNPKRDLRQITGTLDQIMTMSKKDPNNKEDFIDIILTNENEVLDAITTLRTVYPNILKITYDNKASKVAENVEHLEGVNESNPLETFQTFYKSRRDAEMSAEQIDYVQSLIEKIWGEN